MNTSALKGSVVRTHLQYVQCLNCMRSLYVILCSVCFNKCPVRNKCLVHMTNGHRVFAWNWLIDFAQSPVPHKRVIHLSGILLRSATSATATWPFFLATTSVAMLTRELCCRLSLVTQHNEHCARQYLSGSQRFRWDEPLATKIGKRLQFTHKWRLSSIVKWSASA